MTLKSTGEKQSEVFLKNRITLLKFLVIVLPLWFSAKIYTGPYLDQVSNYLSLILLVIFVALIVQLVEPQLPEAPLLMSLFLIYTLIEVIAYLFPSLFDGITFSIRSYPIIGTKYSLHMIPYYGVGAFIGYFILKACRVSDES